MLLLAGGAAAQEMAALPGWAEEDAAAALPPFLASCRELARRGPADSLGGTGEAATRGGRPADWALACAEAAAVPPGGERAFLERRFRPLPATPGMLTGYYEPELSGRLAPDAAHPTPLRGLPPDGTAMPDRAGIEAGALAGLAPHLAYADPVEAFFLQIQGSGRLLLPDGGLLRLGHAGQNGHPYRAIGRLLIQRGAVAREAMSMQAIRAWLAAAPVEDAAALLRANPSYIFFRRMEDLRPDQGPPGTLGVPLTPGRSLAVDAAHVPLGAPVWLVTRDPLDGTPIRRLVQAQDTGGAIRGPGRGDLFWGWGAAAAAKAGPMREAAALWVLVPRAE
jgi:membrane-bound lytic murein transglycosylase A